MNAKSNMESDIAKTLGVGHASHRGRRVKRWFIFILLVAVVELLYWTLCLYRLVCTFLPLPLKRYLEQVWWPMSAKKRRLVIYDQLNPTYLKYYRKHEAIELLEAAGFKDVKVHHRHGYSWSVKGRKI